MKCTVCTAYCPVLQVNPLYPGPKQAGPDGERLRLKDPYFFNYALKYCLNCKRCEVACPSGVDVADLIQSARIRYDKSAPKLRDVMLANTDVMGSLARPFAPIVNGALPLTVTAPSPNTAGAALKAGSSAAARSRLHSLNRLPISTDAMSTTTIPSLARTW